MPSSGRPLLFTQDGPGRRSRLASKYLGAASSRMRQDLQGLFSALNARSGGVQFFAKIPGHDADEEVMHGCDSAR